MKKGDLVIIKAENFKESSYIRYCGFEPWSCADIKRNLSGKIWTIQKKTNSIKIHPTSLNITKWTCSHGNMFYWFFEEDLILIKENVQSIFS